MQVDVPTVCIVNWYSALPGGWYFTWKQLIDVSARQQTHTVLSPSRVIDVNNRRAFHLWRTLNSRGLPDMLLLVTCRPVRRGRRPSNWYRWVLCECLSQAEHAQRGVSSSFLSSSSSIEATCLVAAVHFFCMPSDLWFSSDSSFSCWPRSSLTLNLLSDVLPTV